MTRVPGAAPVPGADGGRFDFLANQSLNKILGGAARDARETLKSEFPWISGSCIVPQ